jgi:hypothetical protein
MHQINLEVTVWVATGKSQRYITYDSFGRTIKKNKRQLMTEDDREQ